MEGKSKMIVSCGFLEDELRQCSKEEGVTLGNTWSGFVIKIQEFGCKRKK